MSDDSVDRDSIGSPGYDEDEPAVIETATATRIVNTVIGSEDPRDPQTAYLKRNSRVPSRLLPSALEDYDVSQVNP